MTIRVAMWSGPRNISTAMMRSFENRPDCEVVDEPFYAAFLAATGLDHPMRDEVLAAQQTPDDPRWFEGTADAVRKYLWLFADSDADLARLQQRMIVLGIPDADRRMTRHLEQALQ